MMRAPSMAGLSLAEVRKRRTDARRQLELARMRAHTGDEAESAELTRLHDLVADLTEQLITRYAADLSLVDSLLGGAYARGATPDAASTGGGGR
jgi:hypothetical protein